MKLRSRLIVAFVLLAVLPLSGLVLYSYLTSTRAFRQAVEAESRQLTAEIEARMRSVKDDLRRRLEQIGSLPQSRKAIAMAADETLSEDLFREILFEMGEAANWIESVEFVPRREGPMPPGAPQPPEPPALWLSIERDGEPPAAAGSGPPVGPDQRIDMDWHPPGPQDPERPRDYRVSLMRHRHLLPASERERIETAADQLGEKIQILERRLEQQRAEASQRAASDAHSALDQAIAAGQLEAEIRNLESRRQRMEELVGDDFSSMVTEGDRVLGFLKASVSGPQMVREVLRRTRRDKGEVPFAFDADGNFYASSHEDLAKLENLPLQETLMRSETGSGSLSARGIEDWVVVARKDAASSLVFGIARPIGTSLSQIRRTSVRNFGIGVGMIGLALLGILPLSGRLTRNLNHLTADVDRLAAGDLSVRTSVTSGDELGQLARAFNEMAEDLQRQQARVLEQERLSKEQEVERRLLEAENRRKSEELEDARRFQLSLLPKRLPHHEHAELAVFMQTATEVGGDYYDFHRGEDGSLTLVVGDATGHGAKAGTMVTAIKSLFVTLSGPMSPVEFLSEAAASVKRMALGRMSMGLTLARLDGCRLTLAAAGMPPVLVCRDGEVQEVAFEGVPLGAALESIYAERTLELRPGDTVLLMSDGFPELMDASGEPVGYERVKDFFGAAAAGTVKELTERLAGAVADVTGGAAPNDDVTFVVLRCR